MNEKEGKHLTLLNRLLKVPIRILLLPLNSLEPKNWLQGFMLWLGILSISITMHADVFEQRETPLFDFPIVAWQRIWGKDEERINLTDRLLDAEAKMLKHADLYVLICDVSLSLGKDMDKSEVERYLSRVPKNLHTQLNQLGIQTGQNAKAFNLALGEMARYIQIIPKKSNVALWTFGSKSQLIEPSKEKFPDLHFSNLDDYKNDKSVTRNGLFNEIVAILEKYGSQTASSSDLNPIQKKSDFEELFVNLAQIYKKQIESPMRVHFIIVSDFVHDIGSAGESNDRQRHHIWDSKYRASHSVIREKFNQMARNGTIFHFSKMIGAHTEKHSILGIANQHLEWFAYRQTDHSSLDLGRDFDFINGFVEVEKPISFTYTPGSHKIRQTILEISNPVSGKNRMRLSLAAVNGQRFVTPLKLEVLNTGLTTEKPQPLNLDTSFLCDLNQDINKIALNPRFVLSQAEIDDYRLLVSLETLVTNEGNKFTNKTLAFPITFRKDLSYSGAISIFICLILLILSGLYGFISLFIRSHAGKMNQFHKAMNTNTQPVPNQSEASKPFEILDKQIK